MNFLGHSFKKMLIFLKKNVGFLIIMLTMLVSFCQYKGKKMGVHFNKAIFLHHSTGGAIWGSNGSSTSVPLEVKKYNSNHQLAYKEEVLMVEKGWPTAEMGWNNEWCRWANILEGNDVPAQRWGIKKFFPAPNSNKEWKMILKTFPVIVIKSCFPSSAIECYGNDTDPNQSTKKTVVGYKSQWRRIITEFSKHPDNFFVIWTNAPLVRSATTEQQAQLANQFCTWAKDTLALGLDQIYGAFPKNVYVFDFFHYLAGDDGILKNEFARSLSDSHPNSAATEHVAPLFVKEVFDAALQYEKIR
jgi:hypothetical protein